MDQVPSLISVYLRKKKSDMTVVVVRPIPMCYVGGRDPAVEGRGAARVGVARGRRAGGGAREISRHFVSAANAHLYEHGVLLPSQQPEHRRRHRLH
ncbi:hypothetical protein RR48_02110 [Papilio machaon]|uniref:Uncharacterized protein n=1 Tax=Papilio machaon TaxID=76193 RepID=A0A0N1PFM8_PAPMA|nr:hypothetical protein RR48_02110 [Papilio machaon]